MTTFDRITKVLEDNGATDIGGIHSWRCEYPDKYGKCDCAERLATELLNAFNEVLVQQNAASPERALSDDTYAHAVARKLDADTEGYAASLSQAAQIDARRRSAK